MLARLAFIPEDTADLKYFWIPRDEKTLLPELSA